MANKKTLKGYFETGDVPNQSQYHELINSNLNLNETETQSITGSLIVSQSVLLESALTASGNNRLLITSGSTISQTTLITYSPSNKTLNFNGDAITTNGYLSATNITASGNISASGNLILDGNITASGNISGSNLIVNKVNIEADSNNSDQAQLDINSTQNSVINIYHDETLTTSFHSRGNINSFIEAGNSIANLGVGTSSPTEKLTVKGNISSSGNIILEGHITASGNINGSGNLQIDGSQVNFTNLPTSDPNIAGRLFRDGTDLKISVG